MNGSLETMTYPSGRVITYSLSNDRVISVLNGAANLATNISHKPFGGVASITYGNGLAGTISYDNQYRISGITTGAILNLNYNQYDADGNIKSIQNTLDPTKNKAFDYDTLDRLSTATATGIWGTLGWTYDGVGNRLTENGNSYAYSTNTNKLTSANGISFGYDNNGNTTTEGAKQYIYNQNQRLIQVNNGATTAYYTYNGNGQRVKKVVNGNATVFHYSLNGQLIAESNSAGYITAEYVYLNGQPLAKIEGGNTYYYHPDHLSTPQKMTDGSAALVWAADYKPFGETTVTVSTVTNNLRFPGQYYDMETGFHYNMNRDYNSAIGRYMESDPIGILPNGPRGRLNHLYVYTSNNPVNDTDTTGLMTFRCMAPLHALGGTGRRSGPDIPGNPLYHEYLCVYNSGTAACVGQDRSGGLWSPGQPSRDPFVTDRCDQVEPDNACIETCILRAGSSPRPYYGLCGPGTNCQEWAERVLRSCRQQCRCTK